MATNRPLSPGAWKASLIIGLVLSVAMVVIGIWGLVANQGFFGPFFLGAGIVIGVLSVVQLIRASGR